MLFRTHLLLGIIFFLLFEQFFSGGSILIFFGLVLLGSLLPDIDEANSTINRWSGIVGRIFAFLFRHRGFFHSLLFAVLISWGIQHYFGIYYATGLFLGYVAHLLGDAFTLGGVQVFYPFSRFKLRGPVKTGGWLEFILFIILAVLILWNVS